MRFELRKPDINRVLNSIDCYPDSPVYEYVKNEYTITEKTCADLISPQAEIVFDDSFCYVLMSIGQKISDYSTELFKSNNSMSGLIANAIADEYLFMLDSAVTEYIKAECKHRNIGIRERNENADLQLLTAKCSSEYVSLNDNSVLYPAKSLGYILTLCSDEKTFNGEHDCSKCSFTACPRRSTPYEKLEVLSSHTVKLPKSDNCSICIDIGTTTLVFSLIKNGITAKTLTFPNPQRRFGADVLSRIESASLGRASQIRQAIIFRLIEGVKTLADNEVRDIIISANTTMTYFLMGFDTAELGHYPFNASHTETIKTTFDALAGTNIKLPVTIIGGVSAFVGGDIVSGIYLTDMYKKAENTLLIDLGTNGEMALGSKNGIISASTAAGPAFEGGGISCGCASVEGAVCQINPLKTIGNKPPIGICGSGIIELVAFMLETGIIDETGRLSDEYAQKGYEFADGLFFTQNDIRAVQTAKSAILTGIEVLLEKSETKEISEVYLCGGFGQALNPVSSAKIGLIPDYLIKKVKPVGNSSLGGAIKYSITKDDNALKHIHTISKEIILGNNEYFTQKYIQNMNFTIV